jgi:hypothetical protein
MNKFLTLIFYTDTAAESYIVCRWKVFSGLVQYFQVRPAPQHKNQNVTRAITSPYAVSYCYAECHGARPGSNPQGGDYNVPLSGKL